MKKLFWVLIIVFAASFRSASGAWIENSLVEKLATLSKDDMVEAIIDLKEQANPEDVKRDPQILVEIARRTQKEFLEIFEKAKVKGGVEEFQSFFIVNSVFVRCTRGLLEEIAKRPEVAKIWDNSKIVTVGGDGDKNLLPKVAASVRTVRQGSHSSSVAKVASASAWWNIQKIGADKAWNNLDINGTGVLVGIIDCGFSGNHPDLVPRWKQQYGWKDFVNNQSQPYDSPSGHGTRVTGVIVAGDNSGSSIGVAPGAQFISAKTFHRDASGHDTGTPANIRAAMNWMLDPDEDGNLNTGQEHRPDVVNNSWGGYTYSEYYRDAVDNWIVAGIFPCFIAHNYGPGTSTVTAPGSYPKSFCVGGTNNNDVICNFSGRGPVTWNGVTYKKPDVVAPCQPDVKFCIPTDQPWWQQNYPSGYIVEDGKTSTSGPHVTGAVALIKQAFPNISIDDKKERLELSAVDLGAPGKDNDYGSGRIDVYEAILFVFLNTAIPRNEKVDLTWSPGFSAQGYRVYKGTTAGGAYSYYTSTSNTSATISGLNNGTQYYFVVTSYNQNGESIYSNEFTNIPSSCRSDYDSNNIVWTEDFVLLVGHFGESEGDPGYEQKYDLNGSRRVWSEDFDIFVGDFGGNCPYPPGKLLASAPKEGINLNARAALDIAKAGSVIKGYDGVDILPSAANEIAVDVYLDGATELRGYGITLHYDAEALQFLGATADNEVREGNLLNSAGGRTPLFLMVADRFEKGTIWLANASGRDSKPVHGKGLLAELRFKVLKSTLETSPVRLAVVELFDSQLGKNEASIGITSAQAKAAEESCLLTQNSPNPFNPSTSISFFLPQPELVHLEVYDLLGQKVKSLVDCRLQTGWHTALWDGTNQQGETVASGLYFCRLRTKSITLARKMLLLR